jgi:hypothetical protein
MSDGRRSLFRPEAVAYHERGLGPGNLVRHAAWVGRAYWILLLGFAAAVAVAVAVRVSPSIQATVGSTLGNGDLVMTVGADDPPAVGSVATVGTEQGRVVRVGPGPVAGALSLQVHLDTPLPTGRRPPQQAVVQLPPERLAIILLPGLRHVLGD